MIFLLFISLACYLTAFGLVIFSWYKIKNGRGETENLKYVSFRRLLSQTLDAFAVYIVFLSREVAHHSYVYLLLAAKRLVSFAKQTIIKVERVLGRIIHATRERKRGDRERGATTLFLREFKLNQSKNRHHSI